MLRKTLGIMLTLLAIALGAVVVALLTTAGIGYRLYRSADMGEPRLEIDTALYTVTRSNGVAHCGGSTLRRNPAGVWELTTGGDPLTRGAESGALLRGLMYYQERAFVDQIRRIVPSERYLRFLRSFIVIFNRNLGHCVPEEYRREIFASSRWCSHEFDAIGNAYERQINYHAAHDIGHVMQEYMLVGCSSFATWGGRSADSTLLVGRNFDFYVGDDFARNKLVTFCRPERGIPFASVGWAGMSGVLSGMNAAGLTVTLNAAKGALPTRAATPISLLARTILQYASTIEEACAIADTTRTFVSESLLIASARDRRAVVIEKTPERSALYEGEGEQLRCTNHYQSAAFADDPYNRENIATSDSPYRLQRLGELLDSLAPLTPARAVTILRDRRGLGGRDIGPTNEKSLNQAIAHHSVVFAPERGLMWLSTEPWQAGRFVCYDLGRIFAGEAPPEGRLDLPEEELPADSLFLWEDYPRIVAYRRDCAALRQAIARRERVDEALPERILGENPRFFGAWALCADYREEVLGDREGARRCREEALRLEIPRLSERQEIERKLK